MNRVMEKVLDFYGDVCAEKKETLLKQWTQPIDAFTVDSILESLRK